ncbi:crossover junction endodeoxyribonuclease RuvC [Candidatus Latescibacterota bacterium]
MKVLGVDPGLRVTGYGLIYASSDEIRLVEAGIIRSTSSLPLERRLMELYTGLDEVVKEFSPDVLAIEELYSHYKHPKTAVTMGHARGVFFLVAGMANIPVFSYSATKIKKSITGTGHATKEQIARMICSRLNCEDFNVKADVTDAIAAAFCHMNDISHGGVV